MDMCRCVDCLLNEIVLKTSQQSSLEDEHCYAKHHAEHSDNCLSLLADEMYPRNLDKGV